MKFSTNNFLTAAKDIVTGDEGILLDRFIPPAALETTGTRAQASNSLPMSVIVIDADGEDALVTFEIPRDYDRETDELTVKLFARLESGTSVALQASAVSVANPSKGEDVAAMSGYSAAAATTIDAAFDVGEIEVDLSDLDVEPGDIVTVNFAASATTGVGVVHVLGARVQYRSTFVAYDEASR